MGLRFAFIWNESIMPKMIMTVYDFLNQGVKLK